MYIINHYSAIKKLLLLMTLVFVSSVNPGIAHPVNSQKSLSPQQNQKKQWYTPEWKGPVKLQKPKVRADPNLSGVKKRTRRKSIFERILNIFFKPDPNIPMTNRKVAYTKFDVLLIAPGSPKKFVFSHFVSRKLPLLKAGIPNSLLLFSPSIITLKDQKSNALDGKKPTISEKEKSIIILPSRPKEIAPVNSPLWTDSVSRPLWTDRPVFLWEGEVNIFQILDNETSTAGQK